nr:YndJ family transporter [Pseudenhygromyxa sp. WMMC2535]
MLVIGPPTVAVLVAISPLVIVPLLLQAIEPGSDAESRPESERRPARLMQALRLAQLPCALFLPLGLSLRPGGLAMLACLPWAAWTVLAAAEALRRVIALLRRGPAALLRPGPAPGELAIAAGLGFPVIGSAWLLCDRLELQPLGFSPLIVILTAAHFHHAGLSLPLFSGLLVRRDPEPWIWRACALAVVLAVPLVAVGITASPQLELVAAWLTAAAGAGVGVGMLLRARELPTIPGLLSALSGASVLAGMVFAASYALGEFGGVPVPDIASMVQLHGAVNALGFGLLGAWSWTAKAPELPSSSA